MGILDELRQEAERARRTTEEDAAPPAGSDPWKARPLQSAMETLYGGLDRFAAELARLDPDVRVNYEIPGKGEFKDLQQVEYKVLERDSQHPCFEFTFRCVGERRLSFGVETRSERDELAQWLDQRDLKHLIEDRSSWQFTFQVNPNIPVSLRFEGDAAHGLVRITTMNLERLGQELYSVPVARVTPELVDQLQRLILRRENRFAELTDNRVAEDVRQRLQATIEARRRQRAAELGEQKSPSTGPRGLRKLGRLLAGERAGQGEAPEARPAAPASRPAQKSNAKSPAGAPVLVGPREDTLKSLEWKPVQPAEAPAARRSGTHHPAPVPARATPRPAPAAVQEEPPAYGWLITGDLLAGDTAATVGKLGPSGATRRFPMRRILAEGSQFRLRDRQDRVCFTGYIVGRYSGMEPLVDFGVDHGCLKIEYEKDGRWERLRS